MQSDRNMNEFKRMILWERLYNDTLANIGMSLKEMYLNGQVIEERRRRHPYPHELCFCLPGDVPYEKAGIILRLLMEIKYAPDSQVLINYGKRITEEKLVIAQVLTNATPVLWNYDLLKISTSGADAFIGTMFDPSAFDPPTQLWIPDRDMVLKEHEAIGLGLDPAREWNQAGFLLMIPQGSLPIILKQAVGDIYPRLAVYMIFQSLDQQLGGVKYMLHILRGDTIEEGICNVIASAEFMRQPIVDRVVLGPRREERRRARKAGRKPPGQFYQVKLRKREGVKTECGHEVNWSHRWVVRSHWRKQFYPSRNEHIPVLIHSYVKGPQNLPLVTAREKVITVQR
jgi:hypothetical protein